MKSPMPFADAALVFFGFAQNVFRFLAGGGLLGLEKPRSQALNVMCKRFHG